MELSKVFRRSIWPFVRPVVRRTNAPRLIGRFAPRQQQTAGTAADIAATLGAASLTCPPDGLPWFLDL